MSDFPKTRHELLRANYTLSNANAICKGCHAPIEWWKTNNKKPIPMDPMPSDHAPAIAHFTTCPNRKDFKGTDAASAPTEKRTFAGPGLQTELHALRRRHQARVVVLVDEFGTTAVWADGIPAEDLRHDLISAGNFIRTEISKKEGTPA